MFFNSTGNDKVDQALRLLMQASGDKPMSLSECLGEICSNIQKAEHLAHDKIRESADRLNKNMHQKPWIYIATAALSGLIIGIFWRRS